MVQRCSVKKGVLRNFAKFTGKHLCQSLFFNKVAGQKRGSSTGVSCEFCKISKNTFLQNTSGRLLLAIKPHRFFSQKYKYYRVPKASVYHTCLTFLYPIITNTPGAGKMRAWLSMYAHFDFGSCLGSLKGTKKIIGTCFEYCPIFRHFEFSDDVINWEKMCFFTLKIYFYECINL